jgi:Secretion system C-terminal sorting domain
MRRLILLLAFVILMFLALTPDDISAADNGLAAYKARHQARIGKILDYVPDKAYITKQSFSGSIALFDDMRINDDDSPETFRHQISRSVLTANGDILIGWEDDRNGDLDIFGQTIASDGSLSGNNQVLISDDNFFSQKMLSFARSTDGKITVVWVDEAGDLFLQCYDSSFVSITDALQVNDNITANVVSYPQAEFLTDGRLIVVWEDSRLGSAVYGQLYDTNFDKVNDNFRISPNESGKLFWSPGVASGPSGQFAVSWEEISASSSNVFLLLFDSEANPAPMGINVADLAEQSQDQYGPQVTSLQSQIYLIGWNDSRGDGGDLYVQIFDQNGNKTNTNLVLSEGTGNSTSDLYLTSSLSGTGLAVWANLTITSQIIGQEFTSTGALDGNNFTISDPMASGIRYNPEASFRSDGSALISITDSRDGFPHIYIQALNSDMSLSRTNLKISDDTNGAQQSESQIARMAGDDFGVLWTDKRWDEGDIYFQRCDEFGSKIGVNIKINDNMFTAFQGDPAIGSSTNGRIVSTWVDGRTDDGLAGINLFAQLIGPDGQKNGINFRVNDDAVGTMNQQTEPDCDIAPSGRSVFVWKDTRNAQSDIYGQIYDQSGNPFGVNFRINQSSDDCAGPAVSILNDEKFVVGWRTNINDKNYVMFQIYNADGTTFSDNQIIPVDTSTNQQYDFDLSANPYSDVFVLAWINQTDTESEVHGMLIGMDGSPLSSTKIISDLPDLGFDNISVDIDGVNSYGVAWSDRRDGTIRSYLGFVDAGTVVLTNQLISRNTSTAREQEPSVSVNGRTAISSWSDNRSPGNGYDIYTNSTIYNPTSAEDDNNDLPLPGVFELSQNYPNPFNPVTHIDFTIKQDIDKAELEVFNILGQMVYSEEMRNLRAGKHSISFEADNIPSGIYMYRLDIGNATMTRKMTLLK